MQLPRPERFQIETDSSLDVERKKLLQNLYEGSNATEFAADEGASQVTATSEPGVPEPISRSDTGNEGQRRPGFSGGEQQGLGGQTMFGAFTPGSNATKRIGGAARQRLGAKSVSAGAPPVNPQAEVNRALSLSTNAAMRFMQRMGTRGGPPAGHQGGAWKGYVDTTGAPPAERTLVPEGGFSSPTGPNGTSGVDYGGTPMTGNPLGAGYASVSPGGNNVRPTGLPTGNGFVPFRNSQSAPGSDRIQLGTVNGQPVYRFQVNPGDRASNGNRTELLGPSDIQPGQVRTYSTQLFVPNDFVGPKWGTFLQFHSPDANSNSEGVNNWGLHFKGDTLGVYDNSGQFHAIAPVKKGGWTDFEMNVRFGNRDGHLSLKMDGKEVFNKPINTIDSAGDWYIKQGYYRADTGTTGVLYSTPVREGQSNRPNLSAPGSAPSAPSGNKIPATQALQAINSTPNIWRDSFQGNRQMHRITDSLFQSGQPLNGTDAFAKAGFDLVVNTRNKNQYAGVQTINIPMNDTENPDPRELQNAVGVARQVADAIRAGKRVLVHCYAGANRSGLINALTLIQLGHSPQQALQIVRSGRPGAVSNRAFERFILSGGM